jgi:hypothetical protein
MHSMFRTSLLLLVASILCSATTITFIGPTTNTTDGNAYVGPYTLEVDGQYVQGVCINSNLEVGPPWIWDANIDPFAIFAEPTLQQLEEQAWLDEQFAVQPESNWVPIQHAIWDLTGTANYTDIGTWISQAQSSYGSVNPGNWDLIVPNPQNAAQSFLVDAVVVTPEPNSFLLIGGALLALGFGIKRQLRNGI